jgi:hypothetical protein
MFIKRKIQSQVVQFVLGLVGIAMMGTACSSTTYEGDSYLNYPDTKLLLEQYLYSYKKMPNTFRVITLVNEKPDTQYLKATEMPWAEMEEPFLKAGFFDEKNDKQYSIQVLHDTLNQRMSLYYKALNDDLYTKQATIQAQWPSNKVYSMYFECHKKSVFSEVHYKLLYSCGKTIQIQSKESSMWGKPTKKVISIQFLNGAATAPTPTE